MTVQIRQLYRLDYQYILNCNIDDLITVQACNGKKQSPIDIVTGASPVAPPQQLSFGNYDKVGGVGMVWWYNTSGWWVVH